MFAWDDLKYFLAFARTGSMLGAAKALGVNQSTVQRRIAKLESRLGRRLVVRHDGAYRLTAMGQDLLPSAEQVETAALAFERALDACDNGLSGTIRVTTRVILAARLRRSKLIDMFHARHPDLRLALVTSDRFLPRRAGKGRGYRAPFRGRLRRRDRELPSGELVALGCTARNGRGRL